MLRRIMPFSTHTRTCPKFLDQQRIRKILQNNSQRQAHQITSPISL